jgi:hypothetical protein
MSDLDARYVVFREHSDLAQRVTRLEGRMEALLQLPAQISELTAQVRGLNERVSQQLQMQSTMAPPPTPPEHGQLALALHALADAQRASVSVTAQQPASAIPNRFSLTAIVGVAAVLIVAGMLIGATLGSDVIFRAMGAAA